MYVVLDEDMVCMHALYANTNAKTNENNDDVL